MAERLSMTKRLRTPDHISATGANELALRIADYWRARGHLVHVQVVRVIDEQSTEGCVYAVRSSLVGGLPQREEHGQRGLV